MSLRVATSGLVEHGFPSINRTRAFYHGVLEAAFDVVHLDDTDEPDDVDAIVNFGGDRWWLRRPRPDAPLLFAMHGGPVLDADLRPRVDHLTTADVLLVNCRSDTAILAELFDGPGPVCHLLDLPIDPAVFRPFRTAPSKELLGLDPEELVLGHVARLVPQKNLHLFLRVVAEARDRLAPRPVRALVVGDFWVGYPVLAYETDDYPRLIARLVEELDLVDAVSFSPADLDDATLALAYSAMDLLVHPTNAVDENYGYAPVEAMACGTPVVGAAYGGLKDTVVDGRTGRLVPTWVTRGGLRLDVEALVDAVVELLDDPDERRAMAERAATTAADRFAPDRCARRLVHAVEAAVEAHRRHPSTVKVTAEPPAFEPHGLLPDRARPPWEYFEPRVRHYVSHATPTVETATRVRAAAPLVVEGDRVRLDDPAWPARYDLDPAEEALLTACRRSVPVDRAMAAVGAARLNRLLADGALVAGLGR